MNENTERETKEDFYPNYEKIDPENKIKFSNIREYKVPDNEFYVGIDEGIRELIALLRDNGINTTCSCAHEKYIEFDSNYALDVEAIYQLLSNCGFRNFKIEYILGIANEGFPYRRGHITFNDWM